MGDNCGEDSNLYPRIGFETFILSAQTLNDGSSRNQATGNDLPTYEEAIGFYMPPRQVSTEITLPDHRPSRNLQDSSNSRASTSAKNDDIPRIHTKAYYDRYRSINGLPIIRQNADDDSADTTNNSASNSDETRNSHHNSVVPNVIQYDERPRAAFKYQPPRRVRRSINWVPNRRYKEEPIVLQGYNKRYDVEYALQVDKKVYVDRGVVAVVIVIVAVIVLFLYLIFKIPGLFHKRSL